MASSIEDILMAKAMADAEKQIDPAVAMGGGAGVGAVIRCTSWSSWLGISLGAKSYGPGFRMAGGVVGTLGGGLAGNGRTRMALRFKNHQQQICSQRCRHKVH